MDNTTHPNPVGIIRRYNMTNLIVTITDHANYGNRLQNYAIQTLLSQYGDVTTAYMYLGMTRTHFPKHTFTKTTSRYLTTKD